MMGKSITELRTLLDDLGIEYQALCMYTSWRVGSRLHMAVVNTDGTITVDNLTPEQAIAATLGNPEIVRCKDCCLRDDIKYCDRLGFEVGDYGYCAWSKRKDTDGFCIAECTTTAQTAEQRW